MQTVNVNSKRKAENIIATLKKQGRLAWYDEFFYSNFPKRGFGSYFVIYYKEV